MRITTHNVNGIRAASRRGYRQWVDQGDFDVICLQEVRSPEALVPPEAFEGYHVAYHEGDRAGRNGVAVLTREKPSEVRVGFGSDEFDPAGRYIEVDLPGLTVASLYLPKGDSDYGEKQAAKMRFMALFAAHIAAMAAKAQATGHEYLVCGDFNIAPTEADIKSWKTNLKSEGFLPEERAWLYAQLTPEAQAMAVRAGADGVAAAKARKGVTADVVAGATGSGHVVDVLRSLNPAGPGPYSWWSWRGQAFDNNAGWRIDHHWATPALAAVAQTAVVERALSYDARISDHAPVTVDYRL